MQYSLQLIVLLAATGVFGARDVQHRGRHREKRATTRYTTITTQVTTSTVTNVPFTVNQGFDAGTSVLIPGYLTMTFAAAGYIYLETVSPSTVVTTTNVKTKVPVTTTSSSQTPTSTSTSKAPSSSSAVAKSSISSSSSSPVSKSSNSASSSAPASSSTSGTMCAWTLDGNYNTNYVISNKVYQSGDYDCPSACLSTTGCKSFTFHTQSTNYNCALFNASIATLLQSGKQTKDSVDGSTSSSSAVYYDAACANSPPSGTNCNYYTTSLTTAGQAAFISRQTISGTGVTPCYHGCQATTGCKSYLYESTSTDASGNSISTCSYYSSDVADSFVAGGWKQIAFDAACVPGLF